MNSRILRQKKRMQAAQEKLDAAAAELAATALKKKAAEEESEVEIRELQGRLEAALEAAAAAGTSHGKQMMGSEAELADHRNVVAEAHAALDEVRRIQS